MKVIHVPYWGASNPYQDQLMGHLNQLGVETVPKISYKEMFVMANSRGSDVDVVHFHWLPKTSKDLVSLIKTFLFFVRLKKFRGTGIRLVVTVHNIIPHESEIKWLDLMICRKVAEAADALIVHGESAIPEVVAEWKVQDPSKIHVIPHANYINEYQNDLGREAACSALELDSDRTTLLFFGGIRPYKGVLDLISAYKKLQNQKVQLVIAGRPNSDSLKSDIEAAVSGTDIVFHSGRIDDEDVQKYFNAADAVIFPYKKILTSGATVLAMSFAKACVVPEAGCMTDVLDSQGAFFFEANNEESLVKALSAVCESTDKLQVMGRHNYSVAEQWSWSNIAAQTFSLYK